MSSCAQCGKEFKSGFFTAYVDQQNLDDPSICNYCNFQNSQKSGLALEEAQAQAMAAQAASAEISRLAKSMQVISLEAVPEGKEILGLVRGSTARSKNAVSDIGASLKNLVGGEVVAYTRLMADAREQALQRLTEDAARQGGDMVVGVRFASSMIDAGVSEVIAWGTALRDKAE